MTKIFNKKRKPAFTLAEVLITLVIIGVIAAATIPTLLQKHFEQEMVVKFKKNVSVLNDAVAQAIRENGPVDEWEIGEEGKYSSSRLLYNYLKPYLKVHKACGYSGDCFADSYKALSGNTQFYWSDIKRETYSVYFSFMLKDGSSIAVYSHGKGCKNSGNKFYAKGCGDVWMDLNASKGPNRAGVDMFLLKLNDKNILPHGVGYTKLAAAGKQECKYNDPDNQYNGVTCGVHVLYKGNMDYLHKSIEDEWKNYP